MLTLSNNFLGLVAIDYVSDLIGFGLYSNKQELITISTQNQAKKKKRQRKTPLGLIGIRMLLTIPNNGA